jgi:chromate transporter
VFLKIGAILYGSGYVLFVLLDAELVAKGLLSRATLIDAIAEGSLRQDLFFIGHFMGYQLNGFWEHFSYNWNIFAFILFVALLNPLVKKMEFNSVFYISRCSKCSFGSVNYCDLFSDELRCNSRLANHFNCFDQFYGSF